jgi:hypothetical protein
MVKSLRQSRGKPTRIAVSYLIGHGAEWTALVFPGQRPSSRGAGLLSDQAGRDGEFDVGR